MDIKDLIQDPQNANRGTERGAEIVRKSLEKLGAGRSVLVDKNGVLIAGNKTAQAAIEAGLGETIVIDSDGKKLVVVRRTDLDLSQDAAAKELAIVDNRASEVGLEWDVETLEAISQEVDLGDWFTDEEMAGWDETASDWDSHTDEGDEAATHDGATSGAGSLRGKFIIPPFSILDARQGYWQERKRQWLALGIQSELGRGGDNGGTPPHPPSVTQNPDGTLNYGGTKGQSKRFDAQRQPPPQRNARRGTNALRKLQQN